ncbi:acyltransferase family protein [Devosia nitrariae]|uniref:Acyltransferase n=1 Tax=Devosia nitrariae TaxID=2071872 RepID=A0ABQ5WB94_9HYPH|nr:acyltransferase family protein [Devosia nitrariae]GLQ57395.1 acyltransferase [Devosia nitrariae]
MSGQRLDWVDTAKGLSILLVVMMHSAYGVGEATGGTGILHWVIAWATPFRMPEFFLISGLFLANVISRDWSRYADRRVVHYLYFYALWAVIHIVFKVGLGAGDPATAAGYLAWAVIQPYGVLWFIYMLAVLSAAVKLVHDLRVPLWAALAAGAVLQVAPIDTGIYALDQFAEYFVYFYAGYALAPYIFRLAAWTAENPALAVIGLAAWAAINTGLVFSSGFALEPVGSTLGIAGIPGLRLVLALAGSIALCTIAVLVSRLAFMDWLRWLGSKSIVVYLAFALPMAVTREVLVRLGLVSDTSLLSVVVMASAVISPLVLYWLIQRTGWGRFLFERPAWAHIPGTPGSRQAQPVRAPAE